MRYVCGSHFHDKSIAFISIQTFLGDYPQKRFTEEKAQNLIARFQKVLEGIDGDIKERNKSLDVPYVYLLPTRTPNSIAI